MVCCSFVLLLCCSCGARCPSLVTELRIQLRDENKQLAQTQKELQARLDDVTKREGKWKGLTVSSSYSKSV